jgi:phosphohistidine phosphatase
VTMRTLVLMRHAKSSWETGLDDHERPLNKRGESAAPRMGRWLCDQNVAPDLILCSTAARANRTADLVAGEVGGDVEVRAIRQLYLPLPQDIMEVVAAEAGDATTVLVVAHNPGVSSAVEDFANVATVMPTAAAAVIHFDLAEWSDLLIKPHGDLRHFCRVKELV